MTSTKPGTAAQAAFDPLSPVDTSSEQRGTSLIGDDSTPTSGVALCLSGGGYRAMLFHLGALWRLNELAYLRKLTRVSSVSGGSITAGQLGAQWSQLAFDASGIAQGFQARLVEPLRALASTTIDEKSILGGIFSRDSISDKVAKAYDKHLFSGVTLQALPTDSNGPRFVINATNVQSGALWRFSRPYMRDYRVGEVKSPSTALAVAVAASSAFPPFLSPARLALKPGDFTPVTGTDLQRPPFTTDVMLSDGGVYDNLGLETAWRQFATVLVSDGGGKMSAEGTPKSDWARHSYRINEIIDNQVRSLRKRQLIGAYQANMRHGTYWGIRSHLADYELKPPSPLVCPPERTLSLAETATRLAKLGDAVQERLINWGYAMCDTAMRKHVLPAASAPPRFPYPSSAV
jgi:NTE family protein